jgi:glutathione S-transferase
MKLYYSKGACSLAVRVVINELGLTCEYESVDLKSKQTGAGDDFLKINSKGSVPTIVTAKGEVLTENAVIQQYLADEAKAEQLLPKIGDFNRYRVLEWINYVATELHKGFSPLFNPSLPQEVKESIFIPNVQRKFAYVDKHLQNHAFLSGDHFTLPDAYLFVILLWASSMKIDLSQCSNLTRYFQKLLQRESVVKSLQEEGLQMSPA